MGSRTLVSLSILLSLASVAQAQWLYNGTPVAATTGTQVNPSAVADGFGGVIFAWDDSRNGSRDIYAQRFNASGVAQWAQDGVVICSATGNQLGPFLVSDGSGGAIVTWFDQRSGSYDVYAQRVSSLGIPQWTANGAAITTAANDQYVTGVASDGAGGAIISWDDERGGVRDIYARRISAAGTPQWTADGVAICNATGLQDLSKIVSDGAGGAIIVWEDTRSGTSHHYAQRVNGTGAVQWLANGLIVCNIAAGQNSIVIASDGAGGAVFAWQDFRTAPGPDLYAQRMNAAGSPLWAVDGVAVTTLATGENLPEIIWDNSIGLLVTWLDSRNATPFNIFTQRLNTAGAPQWTANGILVSSNNSAYPRIVSAGAGAGAIITWFDPYIHSQRVDASGLIQWQPNGMPVTGPSGSPFAYLAIVGDGAGGALMAWGDSRSGAAYDIYAQRIEGQHGYWGKPEPTLDAVDDVRADQGGKVKVKWTASQRDVPVPRTVSYYTIWRATNVTSSLVVGSSPLLVDLKDVREETKGPVYISTTGSGSPAATYWELVATESAHGFPAYAFTASTLSDSVASTASNETFMVAAHITGDDYIVFQSNTKTGHSVDNLVPPAPLFLTAQRIGNYVYLKWNGVHVPDLNKYTVYRATSTGVTPIPPNFLADDSDTLLTDSNAPTSALYYIVTATDVHQNQGVKSNEASVQATTGVGNLPPVTALTVLQNHPNPFTGETQLQVGLPTRSDVHVEVYDVAGRHVRTVVMPAQSKGWNTVRLSARDDRGRALPSGVYFYRVHAGSETVTKKMVIAR